MFVQTGVDLRRNRDVSSDLWAVFLLVLVPAAGGDWWCHSLWGVTISQLTCILSEHVSPQKISAGWRQLIFSVMSQRVSDHRFSLRDTRQVTDSVSQWFSNFYFYCSKTTNLTLIGHIKYTDCQLKDTYTVFRACCHIIYTLFQQTEAEWEIPSLHTI